MNGIVELFTVVLDMSIRSIFCILYVMLGHYWIRLPNARRKWAYLLWLVVALRLIIPDFPIAEEYGKLLISALRGLTDILPVTEDFADLPIGAVAALREDAPNYAALVEAGADPIAYAGTHYILTNTDGTGPAKTVKDLFPAMTVVWLIGMGVMVLWNVVSVVRLRKRLEEAVPIAEDVYLCDRIDNAFILGTIYPDIYLPSSLTPAQREQVLAHERAHIRSSDPAFRVMAFCLLCIHWFNPFVWLAYHWFINDMEATCDETVFADMDTDARKSYAQTLLDLSITNKRCITAPLSFGETHLKQRIRHILEYKAPGSYSMPAVILLYIYVAGTCLTDAPANEIPLVDHTLTKSVLVEVRSDVYADQALQSPEDLFLARKEELEDFAELILAKPLMTYEPEAYPEGILRAERTGTTDGMILVFYLSDHTGLYHSQHGFPHPIGGGEAPYTEDDIHYSWYGGSCTRLDDHWYSFTLYDEP